MIWEDSMGSQGWQSLVNYSVILYLLQNKGPLLTQLYFQINIMPRQSLKTCPLSTLNYVQYPNLVFSLLLPPYPPSLPNDYSSSKS